MSSFIGVFNTTGADMESQGSFFALIFLAMAFGALIVYFVIGWTANVVAQVSIKLNQASSSH
jgi:ATP-binding cassette subfamily B (MDR/TAP) protein 1